MWKSGDCRSLWTGGVPKTESCDSWPSRLSSQFTKIRPPQVPGLFLKMATLEMSFECAEALLPQAHKRCQPQRELGKALLAQAIEASLAVGVTLDESRFTQDAKVA